jgi:hypothetical protein
MFKTWSSFLGPSFKLGLSFLLIYSNTQSPSYSSSFSQQFLQNRHCYCCKSFQLNFFFDRSRADPYSPLSSHQHCKCFSIWTIIFSVKLKYTNSSVYCLYYRDENVVDQCVSRRSNL